MPIEEINTASEVLNSWKEIAAYLNRGVRTVQRWETPLSLPVRRPRGKQRSAVIAMRSELDQWLKSCPLQEIGQTTRNGALPRAAGPIRVQNGRVSNFELLLESRTLRADVARSREQMSVTIAKLVSTLGKMADPGGRAQVA